MPYFRVDDKLHDHRKSRRARRVNGCRSAASIGLWTLAGSWSMANGTDGFVPTDELERWDDNPEPLAAALVDSGLWHPAEKDGEAGYQFHEWDGWQHSQAYLEKRRRDNANRMRMARANERAQAPDLRESTVRTHTEDTAQPVSSVVSKPPTQPNPKKPSRSAAADPVFDAFWSRYPRKVGKDAARKAWAKAARRAETADVLAGLDAAKAEWTACRTEPQFIPHPATWLNEGRWQDQPTLPPAPTQPAPRRTLAQCPEAGPHDRHFWTQGRDDLACLGVTA